jgi:hypothetical protein
MTNIKNEHIFPKERGWVVRREDNKKISRFSENKRDAMEYAGIIALNDGGSVITHKYNGQFKNFKHGNEVLIKTHKIAPIITGTIEIMHPIVNNTQQFVETITAV